MKANLKYRLLQYLNQNKQNEGFTLVELLVVIIIIGILSAIALPSFLNQANKARESEAKTYVSSVTRAQQTYRLNEQEYSADLDSLQLGLETSTANYSYAIAGADQTATVVATPQDAAGHKGFSGGNVTGNDGESLSQTCQTTGTAAQVTPLAPTLSAANTTAGCAAGHEVME